MDETSVEFLVLLSVNSTWTKWNYWNAYKTQTSGAPEHIRTWGFVLAMFRHIHFFYQFQWDNGVSQRKGNWLDRQHLPCRPVSIPYLLETSLSHCWGRLSQLFLGLSPLGTPGYVQRASDTPVSCLFLLLFVTRVNVCWLSTCRRWFCHPVQEKKISSTVCIYIRTVSSNACCQHTLLIQFTYESIIHLLRLFRLANKLYAGIHKTKIYCLFIGEYYMGHFGKTTCSVNPNHSALCQHGETCERVFGQLNICWPHYYPPPFDLKGLS